MQERATQSPSCFTSSPSLVLLVLRVETLGRFHAHWRLDARERRDAEEDDGEKNEEGDEEGGDECGREELVALQDAACGERRVSRLLECKSGRGGRGFRGLPAHNVRERRAGEDDEAFRKRGGYALEFAHQAGFCISRAHR